MRIGILQFSPKLGAIEANASAISTLIRHKVTAPLDLLVLPEMALSGYAFRSRDHIKPYLESSRGRSFDFAKHLCKSIPSEMVVIGYPEQGSDGNAYNSGLVVRDGEVVHNFRKKHLFVTDETWASESLSFGAYRGIGFSFANRPLSFAFGICMDLNPRKFEAPFSAYEFGRHCLAQDADLIVVPMAWTKTEAETFGDAELHTLRYWLTRLGPVLQSDKKTLVVFANRTGSEPNVTYQGRSSIIMIEHGRCTVLGKLDEEEELLVVSCNVN